MESNTVLRSNGIQHPDGRWLVKWRIMRWGVNGVYIEFLAIHATTMCVLFGMFISSILICALGQAGIVWYGLYGNRTISEFGISHYDEIIDDLLIRKTCTRMLFASLMLESDWERKTHIILNRNALISLKPYFPTVGFTNFSKHTWSTPHYQMDEVIKSSSETVLQTVPSHRTCQTVNRTPNTTTIAASRYARTRSLFHIPDANWCPAVSVRQKHPL